VYTDMMGVTMDMHLSSTNVNLSRTVDVTEGARDANGVKIGLFSPAIVHWTQS
jgi:hypothetical protein